MDADSHDDIVYITAGGELGILYGTQSAGVFIKKILDPTLGITLSPTPILVGGAIKSDQISRFQSSLGVRSATSTGIDDSILKGETFYQYSQPNASLSTTSIDPGSLSGVFMDIQNGAIGNRVDTFVRSQYAIAYGLEIEKRYTNTTHATLYPDDHIRSTIRIRNTTNKTIQNIEYLDTLPKIFSAASTQKYTIKT